MPSPIKAIQDFYNSDQWKRVRKIVQIKYRGICQECGNAGWEVHHKTPITLSNLNDPNITISLDNLELLCTKCHNAKRGSGAVVRSDLTFNDNGDLVPRV
jgi:5-methylcytosine-specific restriction endonuclease McrA